MYPGTHAKTQPDKIAVIRPGAGEILTYRQLNDRSVDFTDALSRLPAGKLYKKVLRDRRRGDASAALPLAARNLDLEDRPWRSTMTT